MGSIDTSHGYEGTIQQFKEGVAEGMLVDVEDIVKVLCALHAEVMNSPLMDQGQRTDCFCNPRAQSTYRNTGQAIVYIIDAVEKCLTEETSAYEHRINKVIIGEEDIVVWPIDMSPAERRMLIAALERLNNA